MTLTESTLVNNITSAAQDARGGKTITAEALQELKRFVSEHDVQVHSLNTVLEACRGSSALTDGQKQRVEKAIDALRSARSEPGDFHTAPTDWRIIAGSVMTAVFMVAFAAAIVL
jgi:putative aminopeptidase FrvX